MSENKKGKKRNLDSNVDAITTRSQTKKRRGQNMIEEGDIVEVKDDGCWYFAQVIRIDGDLIRTYYETGDGLFNYIRLKYYSQNIKSITLESPTLSENSFPIDPNDSKTLTLVRASMNYNNFRVIEKLLRFININHSFCTSNQKNYSYTFLHFACKYYTDIIDFLVRNGADINAKADDGNYPITLLAKNIIIKKDVLLKFLDYKPNLMLSFGEFDTLFEYILHFCNKQLTGKLFYTVYGQLTPLQKKVINHKTLIGLIKSRNLGYVKKFFQKNNSINVSFQDQNGQTVFHHLAIISNRCLNAEIKATFNLLFRKGRDSVGIKDKFGRTALYYADKKILCESILDNLVFMNSRDIFSPDIVSKYVLLAKHIKSLKMVGIRLQSNVADFCRVLQNFFHFTEDCESAEVLKMKSMKNNLICVHDLLMKDMDKLTALFQNKEIRDFLKKIKFKVEFKGYGKLLQNRFDVADQRSRLLPQCVNNLQTIIYESFNINFPIICTQEILKYFYCSELNILLMKK